MHEGEYSTIIEATIKRRAKNRKIQKIITIDLI